MHPRRPSRPHRNRLFARALQIIRLQGLVSGEYQPISDREEMYLRTLRAFGRADMEDFIVSEPMLHLESFTLGLTRPDAGEAFTPAAEPAIPTS